MVFFGFVLGVIVGATPGLGGPMAMAISLPILISIFGFEASALLPVLGFLVGIMKGSTIGGAVPAILFNTPGTPDSLMTTLDGYPMTRNGKAGKALRIAHFSSVSGDTFSDLVLITAAPSLAILVEKFLDFPEKAALIILSLAFIASVVGNNVWKGLLAAMLGMFFAYIGTGEDGYPRLSLGTDGLANGLPLVSAVLGVLILGAIFEGLDSIWREMREKSAITEVEMTGDNKLRFSDIIRISPFIGMSAIIGTMVGALPGIGSTLAATLGYASGRKMHKGDPKFGEGAPEGVAATEAANSSVAGANLIPVLSLGIPGNVSAVFIILAMESIGGFNPGPQVFRLVPDQINSEMVIAFGLFTAMIFANGLNWTLGGVFMRSMGIMIRVPKQRLLAVILLLTLTSIYVQQTNLFAVYVALVFGVVGYLMRKLDLSVLPFVIAFILANNLEEAMRQAFAVTGANPWFLFSSPVAIGFMVLAAVVVIFFSRRRKIPGQQALPESGTVP